MPKRAPIFLTPENAKLLEALWNEHSGAVHSMLMAFCGNSNDAGDILQDLFLRLCRDPSTLTTMKSPRAFLVVSARRLAIDLARKRTAELRRQESPEALAHFHPTPATPSADKDLANIIQAALQNCHQINGQSSKLSFSMGKHWPLSPRSKESHLIQWPAD